MQNQFSRTEIVLGTDSMKALEDCRVAVFGVGGVGGNVCEALVRSGIGALDIIDDDKVCLTNLNRQVIATRDTVGMDKVDAATQRLHAINPNVKITCHKTFYLPETADQFDFSQYDYVVDAIDTVTAKLDIICRCKEMGIPVISAMGCGNRVDPSKLTVTDIYKTEMDPLSKVVRKELRNRRIKDLKVVYSTEAPIQPLVIEEISCMAHCICPPGTQRKCTQRRSVPGSTAFVPAAAGLIIASEVVRDLTHFDPGPRLKGGKQ